MFVLSSEIVGVVLPLLRLKKSFTTKTVKTKYWSIPGNAGKFISNPKL